MVEWSLAVVESEDAGFASQNQLPSPIIETQLDSSIK